MPTCRMLLLIAAAAPGLGCFGGGGPARGDVPRERRAALATLVIDNQTTLPLAISFRYATESGGPGGEVGVGTAAPGARTEMAPVPAEEPILLFARGPRFERRLEPTTLEIDEVRTWVIRSGREEAP